MKELIELKREVVEARNQVIKTDHQVKNIGLDLKSMERRFDRFDQQQRLASWTAYLLIAVGVAVACFALASGQTISLNSQIEALSQSQNSERAEAKNKLTELNSQLVRIEDEQQRHRQASNLLVQIWDMLDHKDEAAALEVLKELNPNDLTPLERRISQKRLSELWAVAAGLDIKAALQKLEAGQTAEATQQLRHIVALNASEKTLRAAQALLGMALVYQQQYGEALRLLRSVQDGNQLERLAKDDMQLLLGYCLLQLGRQDEARLFFQRLINLNRRHTYLAKQFLLAFDRKSDWPNLPTIERLLRLHRATAAAAPTPPSPPATTPEHEPTAPVGSPTATPAPATTP